MAVAGPILFQTMVFAADSTFTPQVSVREIYTDNIRLSSQDEEEDFVTDINPGFLYRLRGRRLEVNVDYNLEAILGRKDDPTEINHQLQADSTAEIISERLFFDVRSTYAQTNASNTGRQATDNISLTGNRIDSFTYSVSPNFRQRFGSYANGLVRYTFSEVLNEGDAVDSRSHLGNLEFESGSRFTRMPWRLAYSRQHIENEDVSNLTSGEDETELQRVEGLVRYLFTRQYGIFVRGGIDDNDFQSATDNDGPFWEAGFTWDPSRRTRLEAGYGDAFFGNFVSFSLSHRSRRTIWELRLAEDVSTTGQDQLARGLWSRTDEFGEPIVDPLDGTPVRNPTDTASLTDEVFVKRRFDGSVALKGRRSDLTLQGFNENREFQRSGQTESVYGISVDVSRNLSRKSKVGFGGRWQETDFRDGLREDTRWEGSARMTRQFGRNLQGSIEYRYTEESSNEPAAEFSENRVMATLRGSF